jgi:cell wall-associated NlpC family hydrolase
MDSAWRVTRRAGETPAIPMDTPASGKYCRQSKSSDLGADKIPFKGNRTSVYTKIYIMLIFFYCHRASKRVSWQSGGIALMDRINSANVSTNNYTIQLPGSKNEGVVIRVSTPSLSSESSGLFEDKSDVSIPKEIAEQKSEASYLKEASPGIMTRMAETMSKVGCSFLVGLTLLGAVSFTTPAMADDVTSPPVQTEVVQVVDQQQSQLPPGFTNTSNPTVVNDVNLPSLPSNQQNHPADQTDHIVAGLAVQNDKQKAKDTAVAQQANEAKAQKQAQAPYGQKLVNTAVKFDGKNFRKGSLARCADFVSSVIEWTGAPKGFEHQFSAQGLASYGAKVAKNDLKPGDLVYFKNTYKKGNFTHVGIYMGNGEFVHRPTARKPVTTDSLNNVYWAGHYQTARRVGI